MRWATRRLTVAEMCRWVERGLRVENELRPAKFSPRRVNAVRDASPATRPESRPQAKGRSDDQRRKGSKGHRKGAARAVTPSRETWSPRRQPPANQPNQGYRNQERMSQSNDRPSSPNAGQGGRVGPSRGGQPTICFPCDRAGRDSLHPYKECRFWKEAREKMGKGKPQSQAPSDPKGKAQVRPDETSSSRAGAAPA